MTAPWPPPAPWWADWPGTDPRDAGKFKAAPWNYQSTSPQVVDGDLQIRFPAGGGQNPASGATANPSARRCELEPALPSTLTPALGRTVWHRWDLMLLDFPVATTFWNVLAQWKQHGTGSPPVELSINQGRWVLIVHDPAGQVRAKHDVGPAALGPVQLVVAVTYATTGGRLVAYRDGVKTCDVAAATMHPDKGSYLKTGLYADDALTGPLTVRFQRVAVGPTHESVRPASFPGGPVPTDTENITTARAAICGGATGYPNAYHGRLVEIAGDARAVLAAQGRPVPAPPAGTAGPFWTVAKPSDDVAQQTTSRFPAFGTYMNLRDLLGYVDALLAAALAPADPDPTPGAAPAPAAVTLDDDDPAVVYSGTWEELAGTGKYGPGDHHTKTAGSTVTVRFTGTRVQLYGAKASHHGTAVVTLDGGTGVEVSQTAATRAENVLFYDSGALANAEHVLQLTVSAPVISLDRVVLNGTAAAPAEPTPTPTPTPASAGTLITRSGNQLRLGARPFQGVGVNSYTWGGRSGTSSEVMTAAVRRSFFESALNRADDRVVWRIFLNPGWDDAAFDDMLSLAEQYGAYLVPCLSNHLGHDGQRQKDDAWYRGGWRTDGHEAHYRRVASKYKGRPGILAWELVNEPGGDYVGYLGAASAVLKEVDPTHLVGTGTMYPANDSAKYRAAHAHSTIDICSVHEYDQADGAVHHFTAAKQIADALGKPTYVGEFGFWASADGACGHTSGGYEQGPHRITRARRAEKAKLRAQTYMDRGAAFVCHWAAVANSPGGCVLNFGPSDPLLPALEAVTIAAG